MKALFCDLTPEYSTDKLEIWKGINKLVLYLEKWNILLNLWLFSLSSIHKNKFRHHKHRGLKSKQVDCCLSLKVKVKSVSHDSVFATPWTVARQASLSMGFSRQEHWEWVVISFSKRSSQPRDWTQVFRIVGTCFFIWAT